jgi:hypothetical protein
MSYLDKDSQEARLKYVVKMAGPRYDTRVNIVLPISFNFDVIGKTAAFDKRIISLGTKIWDESRYVGRDQAKDAAPTEYAKLNDSFKSIAKHLRSVRAAKVNQGTRWNILADKCRNASLLIDTIQDKLRPLETPTPTGPEITRDDHNRDIRSEINELYRLDTSLEQLRSFADSDATKALSKNSVLITGQAGAGKTHLLCDVATNRLKDDLPTHIFLGEEFNTGDPLDRITYLLNDGVNDPNVFKKINNQAKRRNIKAFIVIDAINETNGRIDWSKLDGLKKYKNIAVIMSIRSGFENSILDNRYGRGMVKIEHEGFGDLDWQAVTNFFQIYHIPLPRVPIIAPEFRNPLFLKLFCQTYKRSGDFRGHLGTTKLFEAYNKKQGSEVISALGLPPNPTRIWKKIIKPTAQWMADNGKSRILDARILGIIELEFPGRSREVLKLLQRNWLLTKVPHYTRNGTIRGYEYRFPYQKFSDHLIARCLLTTHLGRSPNPEIYFKPNTRLGKIVSKSWNYGLIEALSIQVPERLNGTDLVWVVPENTRENDPLAQGFLQSLVWRDLSLKNGTFKYFNVDLSLKYANRYILPFEHLFSEFLNILLSVAGVPEHPLNARILNGYLRQFSMPRRDQFWQKFLHYGYEDGSLLKRLIDWAWFRESKAYLSDEALELVSIPLIWFLASSNRTVRDRSTKALIELLKGREDVLIKTFGLFDDVNDPYIRQRIYAIVYGCAIHAKGDDDLKKLALFAYNNVFKNGTPYPDVLLRDYARSTIELYYKDNPGRPLQPSKFRPPYGSAWPERVPTIDALKKRYRDDDNVKKDYYSIWGSLMYGHAAIADFGNYVVNSNLNNFVNYRVGEPRPKTERELLDEFVAKMSPTEKAFYENIKSAWIFNMPLYGLMQVDGTPEADEETKAKIEAGKRASAIAVKEFKDKVLAKKKYEAYRNVISKYISEARLNGYERFNTARAQRWLFDKVIKLGWNPAKHGEYDRSISRSGSASRDRSNTERIGKKYQWIALHEILARAGDNFYLGSEFSNESGLKPYQGTWQLSIRDIDPTHTIRKTGDQDLNAGSWWTGVNYVAWNQIPKLKDWVKSGADLPDFKKLLEVKDDSGTSWLNLKGYYTWKEPMPDVEESKRYDLRHKQVWVHVYGYVIKKQDRAAFYRWAKTQDYWDKWMPESDEFHELYYGEFPYSEAFRSINIPYYGRRDWLQPDTSREKYCPVDLLVANDEYGQEGNTEDRSVDDGFIIQTPPRYLYEKMDLTTSANDGEYIVRNTADVAFKDPSVQGDGPRVLLANKSILMKFLNDNDLAVVWTILGEKMIIGGASDRFMGRLRINGAYTIPSTTIRGSSSIILE